MSENTTITFILNIIFSKSFTPQTYAFYYQKSNQEVLTITKTQTHEMRKYLQKLDPNKSTGPDNISLQILYEKCPPKKIL